MLEIKLIPREEFQRIQTANIPKDDKLALLGDMCRANALATVNLYLSTIAETVRAHNGTLDKYIGDSVMAFWGAPIPDEKHAVACVRAALAAQGAVNTLNEQRRAENRRREQENAARAAKGESLLPLQPILNVGTAINSGTAIVGFMGSGKSSVGRELAGRIGAEFVDVDERIERTSGRTVRELFAQEGEPAFRQRTCRKQ
jgi:hypothetical protein